MLMRNSAPRLTLLLLALVASTGPASADSYLEVLGGPGGGPFNARCPDGALLAGFELRVADDVDAIRPLCVTARGGTLVRATASGPAWHGGTGGGFKTVLCPAHLPIVTGLSVAAEGVDTIIVNSISMECGLAAATQPEGRRTNKAGFSAPAYMPTQTRYGFGFGSEGRWATGARGEQFCPAGQVAVGIHGRSGIWLDAMGLICGEPKIYMSLGRIGTDSPPGPPMSLCERARDARARNSPAASNLEAQCRASNPPVKSIGRIGSGLPRSLETSAAAPEMSAQPAAPSVRAQSAAPAARLPICDAARSARARNSPAAPNLEAQCRAAGGTP
jgi:hypothetical protein